MRNHTNDCLILGGPNATCTCSLDNQPNMDIIQVLNEKALLEIQTDKLLDKMDKLRTNNTALSAEIQALTEYPWGAQWTYCFTAMIAGGACMVGLIVGQWLFG